MKACKMWMVEYNFVETKYGLRPEVLKMGFNTEDDAQRWASENTTDGVVIWYK